MEKGMLLVQNRSRERTIKGVWAVVLVVGLWAATLLPFMEIAVIVVLGLWAMASKFVVGRAIGQGKFFDQLPWQLTEDTLTVGELTIPREKITRVTCHPKPGFYRKSFRCWQLNVETFEKSHLFYSQNQTADQQRIDDSIKSLQTLASALGTDWQGWIDP